MHIVSVDMENSFDLSTVEGASDFIKHHIENYLEIADPYHFAIAFNKITGLAYEAEDSKREANKQ